MTGKLPSMGLLGPLGLPPDIAAAMEREFERWRQEDAKPIEPEPSNVIYGVDFVNKRRV